MKFFKHPNFLSGLILVLACMALLAAEPGGDNPAAGGAAVGESAAVFTLQETALTGPEEIAEQMDPAFEAPPPVQETPPLPRIELNHVFQQVTGSGARDLPLRIDEMVRMALANNPDIKIQRIQPELGDTDIRRALGLFDPVFSFSTQYSRSETPQNAQEYVATGGETTESQLALIDQLILLQQDLDQLLAAITGTQPTGGQPADIPAFTDPRIFWAEEFSMQWQLGGITPLGTQYGLTFTQLQARNDINRQLPPSLFYPEYTTFLGLTVTQPLLKNFGPAANLAGVRIARVQKRIGWYEWQRQIIASLAEALFRYFDLVFAFENMNVRKDAVEAARLLERQNIERVQQGKMRPSDVWEAQASLANNIDVALRAINSYVESQNSLKTLILTDQMAATGEIGRIIPSTSMDLPKVELDRGKFIAEALTNRPEYLNIVARAEQEGIRVRFARNQAYPTVDLQGSIGTTGLEGDFGNSFSEAAGGQGVAFAVGVVVSVPLGNVEGRANLEAAKLREDQTKLAIQKAVTEISIDIDTAMSLLETSRLQVMAANETAIAAGNTAEAEEKLLEEGKSTTFEVVRLQNNAADARSRHLAALASYRKNAVRLAVSRGKLLEELGVSLEAEAARSMPSGRLRKLDLPQ